MLASIVSIGSELLEGHLTDTNATFLAQELRGLGIELVSVRQVGDERARIVATLRSCAADSDLVICTGGVGPTEDDLTREAIAVVADEQPTVDPNLLVEIEAFFERRGLVMPERNVKQAWLIPSAASLANPVGTAPGWFVRCSDAVFVAMPGVPSEMKRMWAEQVVPRLAEHLDGQVYRTTTLKTLGVGESMVAQELHDLIERDDPTISTYAKDDGVHIRVTARGDDAVDATEQCAGGVAEIERRIGEHIYGRDGVSLPGAIVKALSGHGLTLAVSDRGSADRFGSLLLSVPEAGEVVVRCVSTPVGDDSARQLADQALNDNGTTLGLGITVDASPADRPDLFDGVVTVTLSGARDAEERFTLRSSFAELQRRTAMSAADVLLRNLKSA